MIGLTRARALLAQAVATQGRDFVYNPGHNGCFYSVEQAQGYITHYGVTVDASWEPILKTGCLIGTALKLIRYDHLFKFTMTKFDVAHKRLHQPILSPGAVIYFRCAQDRQDRGESWGEAYDAAERLANLDLTG